MNCKKQIGMGAAGMSDPYPLPTPDNNGEPPPVPLPGEPDLPDFRVAP